MKTKASGHCCALRWIADCVQVRHVVGSFSVPCAIEAEGHADPHEVGELLDCWGGDVNGGHQYFRFSAQPLGLRTDSGYDFESLIFRPVHA